MASLSFLEIFAIIVFLLLGIYVLKTFFISPLLTYVLGPVFNRVDFKSKGQWALVTGCTDGIGLQYARELARRGCDVVLISRSMDKLKAVSEEIEKDYKVATKIIQADFSQGDDIYSRISTDIADLEIGTLVNNVGVSYYYPEYFLDIYQWEQTISSLITVNMVSLTRMTALVLPNMVKRKKGIIINIGSASSIIPSPLLTVYAASKAYVNKFTEGLQMEYGKEGIIIQCVLPGFVCSNMSGVRRASLFFPTPEVFVNSALGLVGIASKTTGYFPHAVFVNVTRLIYGINNSFGTWIVTRSMENTRRRALKKLKAQ